MAEGLSVKITADITDLTAKIALAKADWQAHSAALRDAANTARDAGDDMKSSLMPALQSAAVAAAQSKAELDKLTLSHKNLKNALGESGSGLTRFRYEMQALSDPIRGIRAQLGEIGEVFAGVFLLDRIGAGIEHVAELGENLQKLSEKTGISVETLSGWGYAAEHVGVQADVLNSALPKLGQHIQEALTSPTSLAAKSFLALGMSSAELAAHSNDLVYVMMRMADSFHEHADGARADALAQNAMGRAGAELIPFLRQGSTEIERLADRQRQLGAQMTGPMAEAMEQHRQAVKDMTAAWEGLALELAGRVAPALTNTMNALAAWLGGGLGSAHIEIYRQELPKLEGEIAAMQAQLAKHPDPALQNYLDKLVANVTRMKAAVADADKLTISPIMGWGGGNGATAPAKPQYPNLPDSSGTATQLEQFRTQLAQMEAAWDGTHTEMLARAVQMWEGETHAAGLSKKEQTEAAKGLADAQKALNAAELSDRKKELSEEIRATIEATRQQAEAGRMAGQTDIEIAGKGLAAAKDALSSELEAHLITARQKLDISAQLVEEKYALDLQAAENEYNASQKTVVDQQRLDDQKRTLAAQLILDLAALQKQFTVDTKGELQKQAEIYESAFREIDGAAQSFFKDWLGGQKSASQAAIQAVDQFSIKFIEDIAEMIGKWAAFHVAQSLNWTQMASGIAGSDKPSGVGGMVGSALGLGLPQNTGMSAATTQFQTAVTMFQSAVASMHGGISGGGAGGGGLSDGDDSSGDMDAAGWGDVGDGSGSSGGFLTSLDSIFTKAESGFSSIFSSLASGLGSLFGGGGGLGSIFGSVLSLIGLDEGSQMISRDGLAIVHSGEMVLPAASAGPFRAALAHPQVASPIFGGASLAAGAGAAGDIHIHMESPMVGNVVSRTPKDVMREVNQNAYAIATRIGKEFARNQSIRGNY